MATLLIVEDQDMSKDMLAADVKSWQLFDIVDWASSREEALAKLREQEYDCILVDLSIWDQNLLPSGERQLGDHTSPYHGIKLLSAILPGYANKLYLFSAYIDKVEKELKILGVMNRILPRPVPSEILKEKLKLILMG